MISKLCKKIKVDGNRCGAVAMSGNDFCFYHNPAMAEARSNAGRKGGKKSKIASVKVLPPETADAKVETPEDIKHLLVETISQVRRGDMAPAVANSVGILIGHLMRVMELSDIEKRLAKIEAALQNDGIYDKRPLVAKRNNPK